MTSKTATQVPVTKQPATKTLTLDSGSPLNRELGICSTCDHRANCLFLKSARHPIAFCEEFDDQSTAAHPIELTRGVQPQPGPNYGEAIEVGICADCESKTDCIYRQLGRTTWDCQDYS